MSQKFKKYEVGELRPSQLLFTYGVGAIVDLPYISAMVMGLEDWEINYSREIGENRLLQAVKKEEGLQKVSRFLAPPASADQDNPESFDQNVLVGVPVAAFPRWMVCPRCRFLGTVENGPFQLKLDPYRPDRTQYVHNNCTGTRGKSPVAVPARFLVACQNGHMDDFPWAHFVHNQKDGEETNCPYILRLKELSPSGEAATIQVECITCGKRRRMSEAFGREGSNNLPPCQGHRPHLRDYEEKECGLPSRAISLGASNSWFPVILSALSVPVSSASKLEQLVTEYWHVLKETENSREVKFARKPLVQLAEYSDAEIWETVEKTKATLNTTISADSGNLKAPEWKVITRPHTVPATRDFEATVVSPPDGFQDKIKQVVLVERLREVQVLTAFTRIESPSNYTNVEEIPPDFKVPISRLPPTWIPAAEVRGEGLFIEFKEETITKWLEREAVQKHDAYFRQANRKWRRARKLEPADANYAGMRYILLHSFSHALMRQLALECGYSAASIRERIYSLEPTDQDGPMAGILLYTAASDSEGTLGGMVGLGKPEELARHIDGALEHMQLCASDPLCAEHAGDMGETLHGAVCHACLFSPETSCERGNKYLDRSVLVQTVYKADLAFFD